jgi:hypothetical protein
MQGQEEKKLVMETVEELTDPRLYARWARHMLTDVLTQVRKAVAVDVLLRCDVGGDGFTSQLYMGGDIWVLHFEPVSHSQRWMGWRHTSPRRKKVNSALLAGRVATGPFRKVLF